MARRLLTFLAALTGLIVAALVAGGAYMALKSPLTTKPNSDLQPDNCSPGPCANVKRYSIWISAVRVTNDVVRMIVKFQNSSDPRHVASDDLQLIDAGLRPSIPITDSAGGMSFPRPDPLGGQA